MAVLKAIQEYYHVGDRAPASGIYRAIHAGHRKNHNVVVVRGDQFPHCRSCKESAVFLLVEKVEYVAHDFDFAGPALAQSRR